METWHVIPCDDLDEHIESEYCVCKPRIEILDNGNRVIVHNSYDGREIVEQAMIEAEKECYKNLIKNAKEL